MSTYHGTHKEEIARLKRLMVEYENNLRNIPKGYISKKNIHGKIRYYLQYRDGDKIISKYISAKDFPTVEAQVNRRKQLESSLQQVTEKQKKLRKVLS